MLLSRNDSSHWFFPFYHETLKHWRDCIIINVFPDPSYDGGLWSLLQSFRGLRLTVPHSALTKHVTTTGKTRATNILFWRLSGFRKWVSLVFAPCGVLRCDAPDTVRLFFPRKMQRFKKIQGALASAVKPVYELHEFAKSMEECWVRWQIIAFLAGSASFGRDLSRWLFLEVGLESVHGG